jgi:hypothetical protein
MRLMLASETIASIARESCGQELVVASELLGLVGVMAQTVDEDERVVLAFALLRLANQLEPRITVSAH